MNRISWFVQHCTLAFASAIGGYSYILLTSESSINFRGAWSFTLLGYFSAVIVLSIARLIWLEVTGRSRTRYLELIAILAGLVGLFLSR